MMCSHNMRMFLYINICRIMSFIYIYVFKCPVCFQPYIYLVRGAAQFSAALPNLSGSLLETIQYGIERSIWAALKPLQVAPRLP